MTCFAFVQAGGGSTRFGTDKALVMLAGKTMLERTAELFEGMSDEIVIVAPPRKYEEIPWRVIADRWPGEGPLGGILTALLYANGRTSLQRLPVTGHGAPSNRHKPCCLIVSCDMPFLTPEFIAFLCERASLCNAQVVLPRSHGGLEPLCACWSVDAAGVIERAFDSGIRKITDAMKLLSMEVLDESIWKRFDIHNRLFWNMNTPRDYEEARRILEARI